MNRKELELSFVQHNANRHLALYTKTNDGLLIWKAYQEFRKNNLAIPEEILKVLDEFALNLNIASGNKEIANAINMSVSKGGCAGWKRTLAKEKQRDIIEFIHLGRKNKRNPVTTNKDAAKRFNTTVGYVKKLYSEWVKESKFTNSSPIYNSWKLP